MSHGETKIGNPEAIRAFAASLVHFCETTQAGVQNLRGILESMPSNMTWADSEHRIYSQDFNDAVSMLNSTLQKFEQEQATRLEECARKYEDVRY
jgi:hypothetical protein